MAPVVFFVQSDVHEKWNQKSTAEPQPPHSFLLALFMCTLVNWTETSYDMNMFNSGWAICWFVHPRKFPPAHQIRVFDEGNWLILIGQATCNCSQAVALVERSGWGSSFQMLSGQLPWYFQTTCHKFRRWCHYFIGGILWIYGYISCV